MKSKHIDFPCKIHWDHCIVGLLLQEAELADHGVRLLLPRPHLPLLPRQHRAAHQALFNITIL